MQTPPPNPNPPQPNTGPITAAGDLIRQFNREVESSLVTVERTVYLLDQELAKSQASIAAVMGQTSRALVGLREEQSIALPGIAALGGSVADAMRIQLEVTKELNTNTILLGETTQDLFTAGKAVGVATENIGGMVGAFQDAGVSAGNIRDRIQDTVDVARRVGVNTTAVFSMVQSNLSRLNEFGFTRGVEGLAKMAATAASMRVNMNEIFNFAARAFNPESSMELVASFQRLGVATGDLADPFRLMYLASEDVEELTNQVGKMTEQFSYFDEETKEFKLFPNAKRDLREIEQATGIAYQELVKMSVAQQKLNQITGQFRIQGVSEEDKMFIANVAQYSQQRGGFTVKIGKDEKLVSELSTTDLEELKKSSEPVTLEDIAKSQLTEAQLMNATMNQLLLALSGPSAASKLFTDPREVFRGAIEGIQTGVQGAFGNQRQAQQDINKQVSELGSSLTDILAGQLDMGKISGIINNSVSGLEAGLTQMTNAFTSVEYKEIMDKYVTSGNLIYEGAQKAAVGFELLTEKVEGFTSSFTDLKKPDISAVPTTTKVEIADINYTGNVNVKLETPAGNTQNINITDQMAYDLFQNPTFQKMNQMAMQNALSQSQYSSLPNNSIS
jgi:hypothetical protein